MGLPLDWAMGSVRSSLGRGTTAEDIEYFIESVVPLVGKLKAQSPVAGSAPAVG
jgi:cysteine sulfinate desulfinase/cysteine desulfurase-like protein